MVPRYTVHIFNNISNIVMLLTLHTLRHNKQGRTQEFVLLILYTLRHNKQGRIQEFVLFP